MRSGPNASAGTAIQPQPKNRDAAESEGSKFEERRRPGRSRSHIETNGGLKKTGATLHPLSPPSCRPREVSAADVCKLCRATSRGNRLNGPTRHRLPSAGPCRAAPVASSSVSPSIGKHLPALANTRPAMERLQRNSQQRSVGYFKAPPAQIRPCLTLLSGRGFRSAA